MQLGCATEPCNWAVQLSHAAGSCNGATQLGRATGPQLCGPHTPLYGQRCGCIKLHTHWDPTRYCEQD